MPSNPTWDETEALPTWDDTSPLDETGSDWLGIGQEVSGVGRAFQRGVLRADQAATLLGQQANVSGIDAQAAEAKGISDSLNEFYRTAQSNPAFAQAPASQRWQAEQEGRLSSLVQEINRRAPMVPEAIQRVARRESQVTGIPTSPDLQNLQTDFWRTLRDNPFETIATVAAESLPQSITGTAIGAATAGPVGMVVGTGANSLGVEYANTILDTARSQGVDVSNPEQLTAFLNDLERMKVARTRGLARGVPIAAFDAASAGLAGRFLKPVIGQGARRILPATGKELGTQMAAGALGETTGQLASEGRITSTPDIALEAIAELATAPGETIGNLVARPPTQAAPSYEDTTPVEPPTEDAQAFSDALDRRVAALDAALLPVATPTEGVQDAVQEQEPSPQVLRTETPQPAQQLGLQEVAAELRPTEEEAVVQPTQEGGVSREEEIPVQEAQEEVVPQTPAGGQAQADEVTPSRGAIGTVNYETFDEPTGTWIPSSHRYVVSKSTIAGDKPWRLTVLAGPDDDPVAIGHIQLDSPNVTSRKKQELTEQLGRYVRNLELSERQPPTGGAVATVPPASPTQETPQVEVGDIISDTEGNAGRVISINPDGQSVDVEITELAQAVPGRSIGDVRRLPTPKLLEFTITKAKSIGERAISAIESLEKKIGEGTYSDPLLLTPLAKLALKIAKQLIRGGMALERAIREAIAQARAQTPDAKDDDAKLGEAMATALAAPETGPSGQTFTGPTRERDKTSLGQSSFYQSEGPARSEAEDGKLASEQVAAFGDDLDRAYSEAQKINETAFRQVVLAEILARTMERLEKSNLHDVAMRNLAARLSETFKAEGREAGQALQSRVQANEKLDPYKPLLSWLNLLRTQFEDQVRKPLGPKVGQIEEGIDKAARKAVKKKTPKEREAEFDKELDKELEQAGIDKPTRKKIRSKKKKLLDVINDPNSTDEDILRVLGEAFGLETEDGETAKKLLKLTRKAQQAPEGLPRHKVIQEMMDLVFDKAPVDWHKLVQDIWFGSVLMRIGTFLNVAVGSSTTSVMNLGLQMLDRAARGGDVKGATRIMHQYLVGLLEGARVGVHIARTGDYSVLPDFQDRADRFFRGQMKPDQLEAMLRRKKLSSLYPGRLAYTRRIMTALDYIFATATRDSSVLYSALTRKDQESVDKLARKWDKTANRIADEQARNELGLDADAAEIAVRRRQILEEGVAEEEKAAAAHLARRVAGNADPQGVPGLIYGGINAGANWIDRQIPGAGFVAKVVTGTPFLRASMNMMQNAMDLFPGVGIAKATLGTGKAPIKLLQRDIFKTTPEEQRMQVVGSLVGMAATVGLGSLVLLDKDEEKDRKFDVTGSWSGFTQQQKKQMMDAGMRPYSFGVIQRDGTTKWISYRQSPLIGIFATIGYLRDHQRKDPQEYEATPKAEWVVGAGISGALAIKDFSALSGLTSIFNYSAQGVDDPKDLAEKTSRFLSQSVGRPVSGFIPSVVKELDEFLDPTLYRENGDKITGYWLRNIPLARRTVGEGPDLNIFGEPVKQTRPPLRAYLISQDSAEPAWRALSHALNNGVFPTYVSETAMVTDGGQRRRMTEPEFYRYREAFGKLMKQRLNADAENLLKLDRPRLEQYFDGRGAIWDSMRVTARQQAFSKK